VLWVRLRHRIDDELLNAAPRLRVLVTPTTGLNHVDMAAADARGIDVLSLRGESAFLRDVRATAEHTIGLMLALLRHLPEAAADAARGRWERDRFKGSELYGKTVGVVGYGRLGTIVTRYLRAFDAQVLVADPHKSQEDVGDATLVGLDELLVASDIVTLHASYGPGTHAMFGAMQFATLKPGAFFVNTARGELIDERALLEALHAGRLAGAALDVLANESADGMGDHPLVEYARAHSRLILTPHIGGCTAESMEKTEVFMAECLLEKLGMPRA
jgi:D-3-phosphoglycerate dehydrogenase